MTKPIFSPFANKNIQNIIFDLGGVILNIDYNLTINAFRKLGAHNFDTLFTQAEQVNLFDKLDKGLISPGEFRDGVRQITSLNINDQQIDNAWNAMLLDLPMVRLDLLKNVNQHYKMYLLSNTNAIHFDEYNRYLKKNHGIENLSHLFHKEYYSHIVHDRKPNKQIFNLILNENGLKPEETVFIDDSIQHVEAANKIGILAYHLNIPKGESIEKLFSN
ncbi:MAG: HAD family hydrolase [Bacteroidales bacterium]